MRTRQIGRPGADTPPTGRGFGVAVESDEVAWLMAAPRSEPFPRQRTAEFPRCAAATDVDGACNGLADDLLAAGFELPSIYLLIGGRLRCRAARGYFQVVDGFTPGDGVIGRTVASGRPIVVHDVTTDPGFIAAVPGLQAEACVPLVDGEAVLGAVNVESRSWLPDGAEPTLVRAAAALVVRIRALGGMPQPSLGQRLAHAAVALTTATSEVEVEHRACTAAAQLSGMPTAVIARLSPAGYRITAGCGPLADALRTWTRDDLDVVGSWVSAGTNSHFPGGDDGPADYEFLRAAAVRSLSVHPLVVAGTVSGVLILAGDEPTRHAPEVVETVELLAAQTAASLGVVAAMQELARQATEDPLTGCGNAAAFTAALPRHLAQGAVTSGLLLIDIDHFKSINDTYGHLAGDRLLQALATEVTSVLRDGDRLYRIGGDEFAALVRVADGTDVVRTAHRILEAARRVRTTVSVGSVVVGSDPEEARRAADVALYAAKAAGRDTTRHST